MHDAQYHRRPWTIPAWWNGGFGTSECGSIVCPVPPALAGKTQGVHQHVRLQIHQTGLLLVYAASFRLLFIPAWRFAPLLVTRHFQGGAIQLGMLSSAAGFGLIAGGLVLSSWGGFKKRIVTSVAGGVGLGLAFLILGLTPADSFWLAVSACAVAGMCFSIYKGSTDVVIQSTVSPGIQGRIFSIYGSALTVAVPIGLGLYGILGDIIKTSTMFALAGASVLFFAIMMVSTPSVMNIESKKNGTTTTDSVGEGDG